MTRSELSLSRTIGPATIRTRRIVSLLVPVRECAPRSRCALPQPQPVSETDFLVKFKTPFESLARAQFY